MSEKHYDESIPEDPAPRERRRKTLRLRHALLRCTYTAAGGILLLIFLALLVLGILAGTGAVPSGLFFLLCYSGIGVAALLVCLLLFAYRMSRYAEQRLLDFLERCDGPESFFIGEGTLATFTESGLRLHAEESEREIVVPYPSIRFFSVCTRKRAREKGEWSVVIELPDSFLAKDGKGSGNTALIQADYKQRLLSCVERHGFPLLGEQRTEGKGARFRPEQLFFTANPKARLRALLVLVLGVVLLGGGLALCIVQGEQSILRPAGVVCMTLAVFLIVRGGAGMLRSRELMGFYAEGIYWVASGRTDSIFLKWSQIERLSRDVGSKGPELVVRTAYGDYELPLPEDAWAYIGEHHADKLG